jgi:hypothetical protein
VPRVLCRGCDEYVEVSRAENDRVEDLGDEGDACRCELGATTGMQRGSSDSPSALLLL